MLKRWLRWLAPLAIIVVLLLLFRDEMPFIGQAIQELSAAQPLPILLACVIALASIGAMAGVMKALLAVGSTHTSFWDVFSLTIASNAWSTTVPGGPAFSAVFTFQVQRRWGASILLCGWFFVISGALSTMWLVVIGMIAVLMGARMSLLSLGLSLAAMLLVGCFFYWASRNPNTLSQWARALIPRINRFLRKDPQRGVDAVVGQIANLNSVTMTRTQFAGTALLSLANRLLDAVVLWLSVWSVTGNLPWIQAGENQTTLAGVMLAYTTAKIVGSSQITPAGLGTVEAAIIAPLVATGMTAVDATGAAIIYRVISFAFITLIGWVIYFVSYARDGFSGPKQIRQASEESR